MSDASHETQMLRLFRDGVAGYKPDGLDAETGDPRVALRNINRLRQGGLVISQIVVRPTGTLIMFSTGEQYYTPALKVGGDGRETEILAELAASSGWGDLEELLDMYHGIPANWEGPLPSLTPATCQKSDCPRATPCPRPDCPYREGKRATG